MSRRLGHIVIAILSLLAVAIRADADPRPQEQRPASPVQHDHDPPPQPTAQQDRRAAPEENPGQSPPALPASIPVLTDEDRRAAFPDLEGHAVHDEAVHHLVLLDGAEWQAGRDGTLRLDAKGWVGRDTDRVWFRADGQGIGGLDEASAQLLYGKQISRWWDIVGGIRQDFGPGGLQTWAAVGVQGLAPQWFAIEATAFVGGSARTLFEVEVEYELLVTNRLILQPRFEAEFAGKPDVLRGTGAGLTGTDLGFRLRYEWRRELAPYVGVGWSNAWGETADIGQRRGSAGSSGARVITGVRLWF